MVMTAEIRAAFAASTRMADVPTVGAVNALVPAGVACVAADAAVVRATGYASAVVRQTSSQRVPSETNTIVENVPVVVA